MAISTADSLGTVASACSKVTQNLLDHTNEHPHTLKKLTSKGLESFRFTTTVNINGQQVEVQVRTIPTPPPCPDCGIGAMIPKGGHYECNRCHATSEA